MTAIRGWLPVMLLVIVGAFYLALAVVAAQLWPIPTLLVLSGITVTLLGTYLDRRCSR